VSSYLQPHWDFCTHRLSWSNTWPEGQPQPATHLLSLHVWRLMSLHEYAHESPHTWTSWPLGHTGTPATNWRYCNVVMWGNANYFQICSCLVTWVIYFGLFFCMFYLLIFFISNAQHNVHILQVVYLWISLQLR
jgi:hypothetical protein